MMPEPLDQPLYDDSDVEPSLGADLSSLFGQGLAIPGRVHEIILAAARRQSARARRMKLALRWGGGVAAAAAMVLVVLRLLPSHAPGLQAGQRVTILDAFSLARLIKQGGKIDSSWDVNRDGVIDQKDVDALAAKAVALPKGGVR
jgi:hypothetical protein